MGEAIDWLRDHVDGASEYVAVDAGITEADLARAIDEYDAAAATAGRLMAENAELRRTIVGMGDLMAVLNKNRDEWKRRADAAEAKLANLRPHPEDEADCAEGMRQAEAGEGVSGDAALEQLKWMIENCEEP